jgi:hypothetical protein
MNPHERALLLGLAEEVILHLRTRLAEIESLHPRESAVGIATFQERLRHIEDLLDHVKNRNPSLPL